MKKFYVTAVLRGEYFYEDPGCPTMWMGSGVYDISVGVQQTAKCFVIAEDEDEAARLVDEYEFDPDTYQLDVVEDIEVEEAGEIEPCEPGVYDVVFGEIEEV